MKNIKKVVATIEARMTSTRLPGKVLLEIGGKPALEFMIDRIKQSRLVDDIVVATTVNSSDQPIIDLCNKIACKYFRGSEEDVLLRVLEAAKSVNADIIVELTGDCPFIDPKIIDEVIELYFSGEYDYASNVVERSFPDGFDTQVFSVQSLEKVSLMTDDPLDRVHVSCYFYNNPQRFRLVNLMADRDLTWPDLRLTIDEQADYQLLKLIAEKLRDSNGMFSARDVISLLKREPDLIEINKHVRAKELQDG
jgi:spore coat polysaccharide biosynthesis protein SpsF